MSDIVAKIEVPQNPTTHASNLFLRSIETASNKAIGAIVDKPVVAQYLLDLWTDGVKVAAWRVMVNAGQEALGFVNKKPGNE